MGSRFRSILLLRIHLLLKLAALLVGVVGGLGLALGWFLNRRIQHVNLGSQRRALFPPHAALGPGAQACLKDPSVIITRRLLTLTNGEQMFCQVVRLAQGVATHVLVFYHGYSSHSDMYLEGMCQLARTGAIVVMPDLPGHGRSDGMLCHVPDWWPWVNRIWELTEQALEPIRKQADKPLKVFAAGCSLGGGLVACLGMQRPSFFDGLLLVAPMLFVSDEVKPPRIAQTVFRRILGPLQLSWPITPCKDMAAFDFRVPEQGVRYVHQGNPMGMLGCQPRLCSFREFAFTFPEWMEGKPNALRTPFVVFHGTADKVTDPTMSRRLYEEAPAKDKQFKLYEGAYHCELLCCLPGNAKLIDVEFLPAQLEQTNTCMRDMREWMAARI